MPDFSEQIDELTKLLTETGSLGDDPAPEVTEDTLPQPQQSEERADVATPVVDPLGSRTSEDGPSVEPMAESAVVADMPTVESLPERLPPVLPDAGELPLRQSVDRPAEEPPPMGALHDFMLTDPPLPAWAQQEVDDTGRAAGPRENMQGLFKDEASWPNIFGDQDTEKMVAAAVDDRISQFRADLDARDRQ